MSDSFVGAALLPGLPHVLHPEKSERWAELNRAALALAADIEKAKPDVLVLYSSQWISVLGTSFQAQGNPKGVHVDENWYDLGDLLFDFKSDAALSRKFAEATTRAGLPAKTVDFEEFPIDTGTITALRLIDRLRKIPVAIVSSWVYADPATNQKLGALMRETAKEAGRRAFFVASSLISARFFTSDIEPAADHISRPEDDADNRRWLGLVESGNLEAAAQLFGEMGKRLPLDMQGSAFHWLRGVLGSETTAGRVLAYGPLWGTGAAVIHFSGATE